MGGQDGVNMLNDINNKTLLSNLNFRLKSNQNDQYCIALSTVMHTLRIFVYRYTYPTVSIEEDTGPVVERVLCVSKSSPFTAISYALVHVPMESNTRIEPNACC